MTSTATPAERYPTHHLTLSDGTTTLGLILLDSQLKEDAKAIQEQSNPRTAMRIAQGAGGYGDFEQPYNPVGMADFSGGLGQERYENDATKYFDGDNVDTSYGKILPAGQRQSSSGYERVLQSVGTKTTSIDSFYGGWGGLMVTGYDSFIASKFKASGNHDVRSITFNFRSIGSSLRLIEAYLYSDSVGLPNAQLAMGGIVPEAEYTSWTKLRIPIACTTVSGTSYHVVFRFKGLLTFAAELELDSSEADTAISRETSSSLPLAWASYAATTSIVYKLEGSAIGRVRMQEFKGLMHAINQASDSSAPKLWRNGLIGKASSNASDKSKTNTGLTLAGGTDLTGKTIKIIAGPGVGESTAWRIITGNTTGANSVISVSPPWNTTHSTATVFVVPDMDVWTECTIGTFAPTKPITDIIVADEKLYLCQGCAADTGATANVCSVTASISSSGITYTGKNENVERDRILCYVDPKGSEKILTTVDNTMTVYKTDRTATDLSTTPVSKAVGTSARRITGLDAFSDPIMPHVFLDSEFGSFNDNVYYPIQMGELRSVRSETMGRASKATNRFLYFTMGEGLERYTSGLVDDVGPDRGEGLPENQRGPIVDMEAYGGGILFAAVDAGDSGYSSILKYNESGWSKIYRSTTLGNSIKSLFIQSVSGRQYQRLWFAEEEELYWLPIAKAPLHTKDFKFALNCTLITSWIYTSYKDVDKYWHSLKLFLINAATNRNVKVYVRTDDDADFPATPFATFTGSGGASEKKLFNTSTTDVSADVDGVRLQLKFELTTDDPSTPVYVDNGLLEAVTRVPAKQSWVLTARVQDAGFDLQGDREALNASQIKNILDGWANSSVYGKRLLARSISAPFDSQLVFLDFPQYSPYNIEIDPVEDRHTDLVARITLVGA